MQNEKDKNWNNFFLGLLVVIVPWLGLPQGLINVLLVVFGLLIALFSLARVRPRQPKLPLTETPTNSSDEPKVQV
jgi:TRAP-type C4-dicarboxylate transport system permease small subunit